ncbi:lipoyl(octanoyl) transferase LipB [Pelagibacterales bacterium SAG-MED28]|nr:lipoyl(octanoyl) transferase LipB [Pelagibacterales bacterium SAG-MED28]|tara:strand:+ start:372 stop:983 length:612 start_codon:yes stop_codon:yes gene_type:complete
MSIEIIISKKRVSYKKAMLFMNKRVEEVKSGKNKEFIWILEHPTTYTAGVSFNKKEILDKKIKIIKTNRGGKITLHNPNQKIIYFVIDLNTRKKDIRKLINAIEKSIIQFLKIYKINAKKDKKNIGIWVKNKKIAAIGLRVSRWIAFHGCSINISNNLNQYLSIIPCGLDNKKITSINKEKSIKPKNFDQKLANIFIKNINSI